MLKNWFINFFLLWLNAMLTSSTNTRKCPIWCCFFFHPTFIPRYRVMWHYTYLKKFCWSAHKVCCTFLHLQCKWQKRWIRCWQIKFHASQNYEKKYSFCINESWAFLLVSLESIPKQLMDSHKTFTPRQVFPEQNYCEIT